MENTQLYQLICKGTRESILKAFHLVPKLDDEEINIRSDDDRSTYLHIIASVATDVYRRYQVTKQKNWMIKIKIKYFFLELTFFETKKFGLETCSLTPPLFLCGP